MMPHGNQSDDSRGRLYSAANRPGFAILSGFADDTGRAAAADCGPLGVATG
jgi:hypothetical protein